MTFFLAISAFIKHYFSSCFACALYDLFSFYILCYVATLVTNGYTICCGALSLSIYTGKWAEPIEPAAFKTQAQAHSSVSEGFLWSQREGWACWKDRVAPVNEGVEGS